MHLLVFKFRSPPSSTCDLGRERKDPSATPLQRQLATLVLGILCLILLITTGVLGYNVVQLGIQRKSFHEQVGYLSSELTSCQNQGVPGSVQELPHDIGEKCPARWSHSTSRSYLFSPEKRHWDQCKYSCSSHSASLITMESREELDFIMTESLHYSEDRGSTTYYFPFWTGLVYDSVRGKWFWEDGTTLSSGMSLEGYLTSPGIGLTNPEVSVITTLRLSRSSCIAQTAGLLMKDNEDEQDFINHELFQYYEDRDSAVFYH
ncbi:hypothetical protein Y1Q_0010536 [Alligator mississippiensis]|uniref:C-type lectin domain-containing protein n=1 Tax=Alligator mississippiensis TaxID=8496 RepID=A0A151NDD0_ALLMI|nr:hypothetical protein Y1Q_0010536 [Alligator mississippiensis]